jgi:hypothetical protein
MECDVFGILCLASRCTHRSICEQHRQESYYFKEEDLNARQKQYIIDQRWRISRKRSLQENLDHWDTDPADMRDYVDSL